jgi:tetratricopeptide (TPR) repeat protein
MRRCGAFGQGEVMRIIDFRNTFSMPLGARAGIVVSILAVLAVTTAIYWSCFSAQFVCDDFPQIVNNEGIKSLQYIPDFFVKGVWGNSEFRLKDQSLYRPLFLVFLAVNYALWGNHPFGFHLINILLHAANAVLLFFLLKQIFPRKDTRYPLLGAMLFAVHPVHVESVAFVSGSTDLLLTFFFLSAFLCYLRYRENSSSVCFVLAFVFSTAAVFFKEPGAVFPVVILLFDFLQDRKIYPYRLAAFFLVSICYLVMRDASLGGVAPQIRISPGGGIRSAEYLAGYIKLLAIPWPLRMYFNTASFGLSTVLPAAAILIGLIVMARKDKRALFSLLWIMVTLLPGLSLAFHETQATFAERIAYLPSVGFVMLLTAYLQRQTGARGKTVFATCVCIAALFAFLSAAATLDWRDDKVFYSKVIRNEPGIPAGYAGVARYYERQGEYMKAIEYRLKILGIRSSGKEKEATYDSLGRLYGTMGNSDRSIWYYRKELDINPDSSEAHVGIGNNYLMMKNYRQTKQEYETAYRLNNKNYEACYNLGMLLEMTGNRELADNYFRVFLKNAPHDTYASVIEKILQSHPELR